MHAVAHPSAHAAPIPFVWHPRTRRHIPSAEIWLGVRTPGTEVVERVNVIREALIRAGHPEVTASDPDPGALLAVHSPGLIEHLRTIHDAWVVGGYTDRPRPGPGRALRVPHRRHARRAARAAPDRGPRPRRAVLLRHDDPDRPGHVGRGRGRGRGRADRCRPRGHGSVGRRRRQRGYGAHGLRPVPAAGPSRRPRGVRWLVLPEQRGHRGRSGCASGGPAGWRSSTSTPTTATAPRRSSTTAGTCSTGPCTWTPVRAGSRTSWGSPTRPARAPAPGPTTTSPCPPRSGDDRWLTAVEQLVDDARTFGADALVVSLGVDAAIDDPESPLRVTRDGMRAAGILLGRPGRADRGRPGGWLPPQDPGHAGRRLPGRVGARGQHGPPPAERPPSAVAGLPAPAGPGTSRRRRGPASWPAARPAPRTPGAGRRTSPADPASHSRVTSSSPRRLTSSSMPRSVSYTPDPYSNARSMSARCSSSWRCSDPTDGDELATRVTPRTVRMIARRAGAGS